MHSPEVLVGSIKSPFYHTYKGNKNSLGGGGSHRFHNSIIDIWHMEPGGADSLTICKHRVTDDKGNFLRWSNAWKWHFWHWKITPVLLYKWRRRLLTRCKVCGGKSVKGHPVNVSDSWNSPHTPFWKGETHLRHMDCAESRVPNA